MKLIFFWVSLFFCLSIIAQEKTVEEISKAKLLLSKGEQILFSDRDSAYFYFESAYDIFEKHQDWSKCIKALQGVGYTSGYHFDLSKYDTTIRFEDSLFEKHYTYFDSIPETKSLKNYHLIDKTNYFTKIKDYKNARLYAVQLKRNIKSIPDTLWTEDDIENLIIAYEFEAGSYKREGKYKIAQDLYEKSLRLTLDKLDEEFALPTYRLLGDLYTRQKDFEKSNKYLRKKLNLEIKEGTKSKNKIVHSCYIIAQNHIKLNNIDSAKHYLSVAKKQLLKNDPLEYQYYQIMSELNQSIANYKEASIAIDSSLIQFKKNNSGKNKVQLARLYKKKATIYNKQYEFDDALKSYQLALKSLSTNFSSKNTIWNNPTSKSVQNKIELLKTLKDKSLILKKIMDWDATQNSVELAIEILDTLKPTFQNEEDKQLLIENAYDIFETGLETAYQYYIKTNNKEYIDRAFLYAEKSKSIVLLEAILSAKAYNFSGIPSALLEQEKQLKSTINNLRKKLGRGKKSSLLNEDLFKANTEYRSLIQDFETNFPAYYNLKYNNNTISIQELQTGLDKHELVISYFYGKEALYAIIITKNKKELIKIHLNDEFEQLLQRQSELLNDPSSDLELLTKNAQLLYKTLLEPLINDNFYSKLMVIPDGLLNYVPFESLHDGTEYIIENLAISYVNSGTLLKQLEDKKTNNRQLLAFAPAFETSLANDIQQFSKLPNTIKEVESIHQFFKGKTFIGEDAKLEEFKSNLGSYGIVHLATHATANNEFPEYSFLAFTPDEKEEYLIYVNDLYAMNINADMVTLSACKSGVGDLKKGEGMLSLSRAFYYAGAKSLVYTLWNINDSSTSEIMRNFYENLSDGAAKDEALRNAKLTFLEKHKEDNFKHPYYWSSFIISGNTAPLVSDSYLVWYIVGSILLIAVVIFRKKLL